jgi:hypothetical protein
VAVHGAVRVREERRWVAAVAAAVALASVAAVLVGSSAGVPVLEVYTGYIAVTLLVGQAALLLIAVAMTIRAMVRRVSSPFESFKAFCAERFGSVDQALGTIGPILLMPVLMGAFGTFKQIMPLVAPFAWDDALARTERWMFFGYRPWELTHALFGAPLPTYVISLIYGAWLPLLFISVLCLSLFGQRYLRARFFVTFCGAWLLLGVAAAYLLSSAGPCYAALIHSSEAADFAPLMARLQAINDQGYSLSSVRWQAILWDGYAHHRYGFAMGISAMPSMHSSIAFLYVLCARGARLPLRAAAYLFAAVIMVGSVHLGWHYLVDGLFAWGATALIWWASGPFLRWCGYVEERVDSPQPVPGRSASPDPLPV